MGHMTKGYNPETSILLGFDSLAQSFAVHKKLTKMGRRMHQFEDNFIYVMRHVLFPYYYIINHFRIRKQTSAENVIIRCR